MNQYLGSKVRIKEFLIGIVAGVILTFIGTLIQFILQKDYQKEQDNKRQAIVTCKLLDTRLHRSNSIIEISGSSVFKDRWDNYIYETIYPWNSNLYLMDAFIKINHPKQKNNFDSICLRFRDLHIILNKIRIKQGTKTSNNKSLLRKHEADSKKIIKELTSQINELKNELIE